MGKMAEKTNCPNCGAPLEIENNKCSYCGTPYFDMSTVQIGGEPILLKIKDAGHTIITKARLTNANLTYDRSYQDFYSDNILIMREPVVRTKISLDFISDDAVYCKDT